MADAFIQVRTNEQDKARAVEILNELGTNMSAVVNMLVKQIVLTGGVPFDIVLPESGNSKRVSKYRVKDLEAVLAKVPASVEEVWVFGSTVTKHCRPESDLDICIIGNTTMQEESAMFKAAKCSVDIITETPEGFAAESKTPGSVYKEVKEKGLMVYKKGETIEWQRETIPRNRNR